MISRTTITRLVGFSARRSFSNNPTVLYSWGIGTDGQLGHQNFEVTMGVLENQYAQATPRKILKSKQFTSAAVGMSTTLALNENGEVFSWGADIVKDGKLASKVPVKMPLSGKYKKASLGINHAALVDQDGQVYTWGQEGDWLRGGGYLGHGDRTSVVYPKHIEAFAEYGAKAADVACGGKHTLILTDDGEVLSFGVGEYGRLGTGNTEDCLIPTSVEALDHEDVVQIAVGVDHSLALTATGSIYSWGRNNLGQLGHADSYIDIYSMEDFPRHMESENVDGLKFVSIAAGQGRSAAITDTGRLFVWGGRLSHEPKLFDIDLFDGLKIKKVACGGDNSKAVVAAITEDGGLWTFGDASSRMLGGSTGGPLPSRLPAFLNRKVVDITCGFGQHMMAFVEFSESD